MTVAMKQAAFDIDSMVAEVNPRPAYTGRAPLHFTAEYFTPAELQSAFEEWCAVNGSFGSHPRSHMWVSFADRLAPEGHTLGTMTADLRCHGPSRDHPSPCFCPGDLMSRAQCDRCRFVSIGRGNDVIEAWHDHAWPGWRDLPVVPQDVRPAGGGFGKSEKRARAWVAEHYPSEWQVEGAPVLTQRAGIGNAHVPSYSPWGGYDIAADLTRAA